VAAGTKQDKLQFGKRAAGAPLLINGQGTSVSLDKLSLDKKHYPEAWLQKLIFDHPEALPVSEIEPGFGAICPVAMEVPCAHGNIDNLYITTSGDIVLVEAKLWKNPEARREVVAQALDYVAALTGMGYEAFERACRKGQGMTASSLYGLVAERPEALDEQAFIDAVSRNLARGRMLVIALGDGIRAETEALSEFLQSHAGAHFTFALVELAIWRNSATGELLAVPSTLAQTVMITRGIVTVENGMATVKPVPADPAVKPASISSELFFEALARTDPKLPALVLDFVRCVEPLGVFTEQRSSLLLKIEGPEKPLNIGYIDTKGQLWTDAGGAMPNQAYRDYLRTLANLIGGRVGSGTYPYVLDKTGAKPLVSALLPHHAASWRSAIADLISATRLLAEGKELADTAMPFAERYSGGFPVMAVVDGKPRSPVVAFVMLEDGFAWCDDGVLSPMGGGNPLHLIKGPVEALNGTLRCGQTLLMPIDDDDAEWLDYWRAIEAMGDIDATHAKYEAMLKQLAGAD